MAKICTFASRKGGVGKSTLAYETAYLLDAVLIDLEWDGGSSSRRWGYRPELRSKDPMLEALEHRRPPKPLKGFKKPSLIPGSSQLVDVGLDADAWADRLGEWAESFDHEWVVIDTHPGASPSAHGAMAAANVICSPAGLRTEDLNAVEQLVSEMADYPLAIVPNMVRRVPPAAELARLGSIIKGTPVQVAPPVPFATPIETRKRRMAMTAESPTPKRLIGAVTALQDLAHQGTTAPFGALSRSLSLSVGKKQLNQLMTFLDKGGNIKETGRSNDALRTVRAKREADEAG